MREMMRKANEDKAFARRGQDSHGAKQVREDRQARRIGKLQKEEEERQRAAEQAPQYVGAQEEGGGPRLERAAKAKAASHKQSGASQPKVKPKPKSKAKQAPQDEAMQEAEETRPRPMSSAKAKRVDRAQNRTEHNQPKAKPNPKGKAHGEKKRRKSA